MNKKLFFSGLARTMTRSKLRTFFMSLGVVLGVAVLVVTRSMGTGAEKAMLDNLARMFSSSNIFVRAGGGSMNRQQDGPVTTLKLADLEAIDEELDEVIAWDPILGLPGQDATFRGRSHRLTVYGFSDQAELVWGRGVAAGAHLDAEDVRSSSRVALLGPKVAEDLFSEADPVDQQIRIGSVPFRVKGVLEPYGMDPHGNDRDDEIHVPVTTLMRRLMNVDYITGAKLLVDDPEQVEAVAARVTDLLRRRHNIAADEADDFSLVTPALVKKMVGKANRVFKVFLPAAAGVALLVAMVVIANIMLVSVKERLAEIGLRKAMGATARQIGLQFLAEAIAVTLLSGLAGTLLGVGVVAAMSKHMGMAVLATPDAIVLGLLAATVVGPLSGTVPARRAARLDPVEALR